MAEINKKSLGEGVITFAHPYTFEGKEYDGVDLSALDNMTTEQLIQCDRIFESSGSVSAPSIPSGMLLPSFQRSSFAAADSR